MSDIFGSETGVQTEPAPGGFNEDDFEDIIDEIDLYALAEELYALLRKELRLERERQGWHSLW